MTSRYLKGWAALESMTPWDTAFMEHMPFMKMWKDLVPGGNALRASPRTLHGYYESPHPRTQDLCRYFPFKQEITVNGSLVPSIHEILKKHYFPGGQTDDQRINYVVQKTGQEVDDVAKKMFEMRYLRNACAQQMRIKIKGEARNVMGNFDIREKEYLLQATLGAAGINKNMFINNNFDPIIAFSPYYRCTAFLDVVSNRQAKSDLIYLLTDVVLDETIPRSRLCHVKEPCRGPCSHLEPSIYNMHVVRQSMTAHILKMENYVVDNMGDGGPQGHSYLGCLLHIHKTSDLTELTHTLEPLTLDLKLGREVLHHYRMTYGR